MATDDGMDSEEEEGRTLADRIRDARNRVQRSETGLRARRRARSRRLNRGEAKTTLDAAALKKRRVEEASDEARGLAGDVRGALSTAANRDGADAADEAATEGSGLIQRITDIDGDRVGDLLETLAPADTDGDGRVDGFERVEAVSIDTNSFDSRGTGSRGVGQPTRSGARSQPAQSPIEPPVGDVEDDFDELSTEGVEAEVGLDYPLEEF